jgi:hypothetical protein
MVITEEGIKIEFKLYDWETQFVTQQLKGEVVLHDRYMTKEVEMYCDEITEDTGVPLTDVYRTCKQMFLRSHIIGTQVERSEKWDKYHLMIVLSVGDSVDIWFDTSTECYRVTDIVNEWILSS